MKKFTKSHEWIDKDGKVGVTAHALKELGDIVFIELPDEGDSLSAGDACAVIESHKAASDVYAPISGVVSAQNTEVTDNPEDIAQGSDLWLFSLNEIDQTEWNNLMDEKGYNDFLASEG